MTKIHYMLDGADFRTLEQFFDQVSAKLIPDAEWGRNLDAFNDILRGGFGTPEDGFVLEWKNSETSKTLLGYNETVRQLQLMAKHCHTANRTRMQERLELAKECIGDTVYDWLVDIIRVHCAGGRESDDGVELELK